MPRNKCFAPGCTSGYLVNRKKCKEDGIKVCSLFKCRNNEFLEKWQKAIPRGDRIFTKDDALCELHFEVESICTYFETVLPDGSVHKIEREKPTLKKDAIPCIFPNLPTYLSSSVKKRKAPSIRKGLPCKKICSVASQPIIPPDSNVASDPIIAPDPNVASDPLITPVLHYVLTFEILSKNLNQIKTPNVWWSINVLPNSVICAKWTGDHNLERRVVVNENLKIKVFMLQTQCNTDIEHEVSTIDGLSSWLKQVEDYQMCVGINDRNINKSCLGVATLVKDGRKSNLCSECRKEKKKFQRRSKRPNIERSKQFRGRLICSERKQLRLKKKVATLNRKVEGLRTECSLAKEEAVENAISSLPTSQQENVRACHAAALVKNKKSIRYTTQWVYECLLIRIKSRKAYEHLRAHNILALPSIVTLGKYIKKVKGVYGFQGSIFNCLKKKSAEMSIQNRRGSLLLDEMKVSPSLSFDSNSLKVSGFTDLGKYTPDHQKTQKGDHALVFMFQPFKGTWVQALACFLSRGAAPGDVLHHLIVECIILLENSGFLVDAVISDGATWNRNMWSIFGITLDNVSCSHICDAERRLWFLSDFPHLIKNVRNAVTDKKFMLTPDGTVNLKYWETVVAIDGQNTLALKACPLLTPDHINPKAYMKMNVAMAFQFFSRSVAAGMQHFKVEHPESCLKDSNGCVKFINRFNDLIDAMNSRCPKTALKPDSNAEKRFFGMMRNACGSNDHPDAKVFLQLFRLIGTYSLVKPPKGSNISGSEMLRALVGEGGINDSVVQACGLRDMLDSVLDKGTDMHIFAESSNDPDHNYYILNSADYVVAYVAGYVARRSQRFTKCDTCKAYLLDNTITSPANVLIDLKSKGWLLKPSLGLFNLVKVMEVVARQPVSVHTLHEIVETLSFKINVSLVGCLEHQHDFSNSIMRFYLVTRMHFLCNRVNQVDAEKVKKTKELRKLSKLT